MSLESRTRKLISRPWVAYGTILALQVRIIWNVWRYRDISGEDSHRRQYDVFGRVFYRSGRG